MFYVEPQTVRVDTTSYGREVRMHGTGMTQIDISSKIVVLIITKLGKSVLGSRMNRDPST